MNRTTSVMVFIMVCAAVSVQAEAMYVGGMNTYQYVRTAPTRLVDPLGLREVDCVACGGCNGKVDAREEVDRYIRSKLDSVPPERLKESIAGGLFRQLEEWAETSLDVATPAPERSKYRGSELSKLLGPCVKLCGQCVGTDKLGHMMAQGWQYYLIADIDGYGDQIAEKYGRYTEGKGQMTDFTADEIRYFKLIAGSRLYLFGFYGINVSGVMSNADLAANSAGHRFYRDLMSGRHFKTICEYVSQSWDEEVNVNEYAEAMGKIVAANGRR